MIQKESIKNILMRVLPNPTVVSGGNEIATSCPFCGEQRPKFYLGPFNDPNKPIQYNCFICKAHGYVNESFLDNIGVYTNDTDLDIIKSNKSSGIRMGFKGNNNFYNILWDNVTVNEITEYKLKYINNRLGLRLTYQDCINNKIILNLKDLLNRNSITYLTRYPTTVEQLNNYFIGFLSRSNASLNMRNLIEGSYNDKLEESLCQKYINYKVFKDTPDNDFYILPCNIDITKPIKLYIAEGPFDILGIKYNLIKSEDNCVFIAGRGKAYEKALYWFIHKVVPFHMEVHFFPDKDIDDKFITRISNKYNMFGYKYYLHRNMYRNEKDFGVPEWNIDDFCYPI